MAKPLGLLTKRDFHRREGSPEVSKSGSGIAELEQSPGSASNGAGSPG